MISASDGCLTNIFQSSSFLQFQPVSFLHKRSRQEEAGVQTPSGHTSLHHFSSLLGPSLQLPSPQLSPWHSSHAHVFPLLTPRHLMRTPLQTTRSPTASCRRLPSATTSTSRCQKGMEVSAGPGTTGPPLSVPASCSVHECSPDPPHCASFQ